jgi:hypothetical protein
MQGSLPDPHLMLPEAAAFRTSLALPSFDYNYSSPKSHSLPIETPILNRFGQVRPRVLACLDYILDEIQMIKKVDKDIDI